MVIFKYKFRKEREIIKRDFYVYFMKDIIYVVCMRLQRINGDYHYDPCVDPSSPDKIQMLSCDNLISLQTENKEAIDMLRMMGDVVIVPLPLDIYTELDKELNSLVSGVNTQIDEAVSKMAEAYKLMNIECDVNTLKTQMMTELTNCGSSGKVLNSDLEIVDRTDDYVLLGDDDGYEDEIDEDEDEDNWEDDDWEDEDDDYEEDE